MDYNKLYQASRDNNKGMQLADNIPPEIKNHPDFKKNMRKFLDIKSDTQDIQSEYQKNVNKFFNEDQSQVGNDRFTQLQNNVEVN